MDSSKKETVLQKEEKTTNNRKKSQSSTKRKITTKSKNTKKSNSDSNNISQTNLPLISTKQDNNINQSEKPENKFLDSLTNEQTEPINQELMSKPTPADVVRKQNQEEYKKLLQQHEMEKQQLHKEEEELQENLLKKEKEILTESSYQEKYKEKLNSLLKQLNDVIESSKHLIFTEYQPNNTLITQLEQIIQSRKKEIQVSKSQNRIYKEQYDLYLSKSNSNTSERLIELERKTNQLLNENNELIKKIREWKNKQNVKSKVLENYSAGRKFPLEIKSNTEEIKTWSNKKHEYLLKWNNNKKALSNLFLQMERLQKMVQSTKEKNVSTSKIDEEIYKLSLDLKGSEDEIFDKAEKEETLIQKQSDENYWNNNFNMINPKRTPRLLKPINSSKIKPNKTPNQLYPSSQPKIKAMNNKITAHDNITAKPTSRQVIKDKEKDEFDISGITYETLTDYEYREMIIKKEQCYDWNLKLEKSIREAKKMYERKLKEMNNQVDLNTKKLSCIEQENEWLKSEISDLTKISLLNEEENRRKYEENNKRLNKNDSYKQYKNQKDIIHGDNNNDPSDTRNDILNDLQVLDVENNKNNHNKYPTSVWEEGQDAITNEIQENKQKMEIEDISKVENIDEFDKEVIRERTINDIKKKYNFKLGDAQIEIMKEEENPNKINKNENDEKVHDEDKEKENLSPIKKPSLHVKDIDEKPEISTIKLENEEFNSQHLEHECEIEEHKPDYKKRSTPNETMTLTTRNEMTNTGNDIIETEITLSKI